MYYLGTYSVVFDSFSNSSCINCPVGRYSSSNASSCYACPIGSFNGIGFVGSPCQTCPANTTSMNFGSTACVICYSGVNAANTSGITAFGNSDTFRGRYNFAGTAVGTLALFGGGYVTQFSSVSSLVSILDISVGRWTIGNFLSVARQGLAAATAGSLAIFAGGRISTSAASLVVDIYDSVSKQWSAFSTSSSGLSVARYNLASASLDTLAYFAGGTPDGSTSLFTVDIYNSSSRNWRSGNLLGTARHSLAGVSAHTKIIFAGGTSGTDSGAIDVYDVISFAWSTGTLSLARTLLSAVSVGTVAYFAGGQSSGSAVNRVDIFDAVSLVWTTSALTFARYSLASVVSGCKAIFAGGYVVSGPSNVIEVYDSFRKVWSLFTVRLSVSRSNLVGVSVSNSIGVFAGGMDAAGSSSTRIDYVSATCLMGIFD